MNTEPHALLEGGAALLMHLTVGGQGGIHLETEATWPVDGWQTGETPL